MTPQTRVAVAQVVDTLELGGKERVAVTLANELAARGYDSHLICTRAFGPLRSAVSTDVQAWCAERSWRGDLAGLRRLARRFDECHIVLAHTHNEGASYLVRLARLLTAQPPVQVVHDHRGHILDSRKHVWLDRLFLSGVDGFIAVSEQLQMRAARLLGLPPERCRLVPNGIELPESTPYSDGPATVVQVATCRSPRGTGRRFGRRPCSGNASPGCAGSVSGARRRAAPTSARCAD
jgi:glycosyltransferase involved in cell wall biosynthesis